LGLFDGAQTLACRGVRSAGRTLHDGAKRRTRPAAPRRSGEPSPDALLGITIAQLGRAVPGSLASVDAGSSLSRLYVIGVPAAAAPGCRIETQVIASAGEARAAALAVRRPLLRSVVLPRRPRRAAPAGARVPRGRAAGRRRCRRSPPSRVRAPRDDARGWH